MFLRLYATLKKGEKIQNPRAWIFRVAHNLGLKIRARQNSLAPFDPDLESQIAASDPESGTEPARAGAGAAFPQRRETALRTAAALPVPADGGLAVSRDRIRAGHQRFGGGRIFEARHRAAEEGGAMSGHPDSEALLRYADGESPAGGAAAIRSHLEACWQCRAQMDEIQKTVGACVRYRKEVLEVCLPAPPKPWTDIYRQFEEIDAADRKSFGERFRLAMRPTVWAPAAIALAVAAVVWFRFQQPQPVQAAELLREAVASASARPSKPRRIEIRTRDRRVTRISGQRQGDALEARFAAAHYDWVDPLSAKAYQSWRDQLSAKQDAVVEQPGAYRIETSAPSGELARATLTLRTADLAPVAERLEFRNSEWLEITLVSEEPPVTIAAAPPEPNAAGRPAAKAPATTVSIGTELRVLTALHELGADLGDPIEVSRSSGTVLVAGVGIAPERRRQILDALRAEQGVVVRFSDPAPKSRKRTAIFNRRAPAVVPCRNGSKGWRSNSAAGTPSRSLPRMRSIRARR